MANADVRRILLAEMMTRTLYPKHTPLRGLLLMVNVRNKVHPKVPTLILETSSRETPSYSQREESYGGAEDTYGQDSYNTTSYQSGRGEYEDTSVQESFSNLNVRDVAPISLIVSNK